MIPNGCASSSRIGTRARAPSGSTLSTSAPTSSSKGERIASKGGGRRSDLAIAANPIRRRDDFGGIAAEIVPSAASEQVKAWLAPRAGVPLAGPAS